MRRIIDRLREKVRSGEYILSYHAIDEMRDDEFEEEDFEAAILSGRVVRRQKDRLARRKYTVEGSARDKRTLRAVCRFADASDKLVVITIYHAS